MGGLLLVGVVFVIIGVAVLIAGGVALWKQARKSGSGVKAMGIIVDLVSRVFNPGSAGVYCPVVEFTTASGEPVRFESQFGTMPASHRVGQSIAVRYDPADPQKAEVDTAMTNWFAPGCMTAMGLGFLGMGVVFLVIGIVVLSSQNHLR